MNGPPSDAQDKALEFVSSASSYVLLATIALLGWVASGVEFSNDGLRVASMACLTLSVVFGVATLALIPLVQEARRPGQSNFEVEARFMLLGQRGARLKSALLPQYLFLLAGLIFYVIGMISFKGLRRLLITAKPYHGQVGVNEGHGYEARKIRFIRSLLRVRGPVHRLGKCAGPDV